MTNLQTQSTLPLAARKQLDQEAKTYTSSIIDRIFTTNRALDEFKSGKRRGNPPAYLAYLFEEAILERQELVALDTLCKTRSGIKGKIGTSAELGHFYLAETAQDRAVSHQRIASRMTPISDYIKFLDRTYKAQTGKSLLDDRYPELSKSLKEKKPAPVTEKTTTADVRAAHKSIGGLPDLYWRHREKMIEQSIAQTQDPSVKQEDSYMSLVYLHEKLAQEGRGARKNGTAQGFPLPVAKTEGLRIELSEKIKTYDEQVGATLRHMEQQNPILAIIRQTMKDQRAAQHATTSTPLLGDNKGIETKEFFAKRPASTNDNLTRDTAWSKFPTRILAPLFETLAKPVAAAPTLLVSAWNSTFNRPREEMPPKGETLEKLEMPLV